MDLLIPFYDKQYEQLHQRSVELIRAAPADRFYWKPGDVGDGSPNYSCGEAVLRCAGTVEQTFGGITTNLWDDPFEWTLPETLSSLERILGYLEEVETTRQLGFEFFKGDGDLMKEIVMSSGKLQTISDLLQSTLTRAARYQRYALESLRQFSDATIPGF